MWVPKVLIRGHVFSYEEKAPFLVSGESVFGAIEYDDQAERVRCHECGEWFECISHTHLANKHGMIAAEYKIRHGINLKGGLCTPRFSRMRSGQGVKDPVKKASQTAVLIEAGREHKRVHGNNRRNRKAHSEKENEVGRCKAQSLFRIQVLAADLMRTPTNDELRDAGLHHPLLVKHFGSAENALRMAGLNIRPSGKRTYHVDYGRLPDQFPTKAQLLEVRMPWPKEYFQTGDRALEKRRVA